MHSRLQVAWTVLERAQDGHGRPCLSERAHDDGLPRAHSAIRKCTFAQGVHFRAQSSHFVMRINNGAASCGCADRVCGETVEGCAGEHERKWGRNGARMMKVWQWRCLE